jgi:hypothetical protein
MPSKVGRFRAPTSPPPPRRSFLFGVGEGQSRDPQAGAAKCEENSRGNGCKQKKFGEVLSRDWGRSNVSLALKLWAKHEVVGRIVE